MDEEVEEVYRKLEGVEEQAPRSSPLVERLRDWFRCYRPDILERPGKCSSWKEVRALEIWSGFELPDSFWALMQTLPLTEKSDFCWPGGYFKWFDGYDASDILEEAVDNIDLTGVDDWWHKGWLPLMQTASGDMLCIDTVGSFGGKPGQILEHHYDLGPRDVVYDDFDCYLSVIVEALEKGYFHPDGLEEELEAFERLEIQEWEKFCQLRLSKVSSDLPVGMDVDPS